MHRARGESVARNHHASLLVVDGSECDEAPWLMGIISSFLPDRFLKTCGFSAKPVFSLLSREILPKSREHRPSSLLISVLSQWLTTSSRPLTEQGETWGLAGRNRENLEPLQGELVLRSSRGASDSPRDQRRRGVAHALNRWSGATTFS